MAVGTGFSRPIDPSTQLILESLHDVAACAQTGRDVGVRERAQLDLGLRTVRCVEGVDAIEVLIGDGAIEAEAEDLVEGRSRDAVQRAPAAAVEGGDAASR